MYRMHEIAGKWKAAVNRRRRVRPVHIVVKNVLPLADQTISLASGITVLCGSNGIGKTRLFRAIRDSGNGVPGCQIICDPPLGDSPLFIEYLDSYELMVSCKEGLGGGAADSEYLEAYSPSDQTEAEFGKVASWILNRKYDKVLVYEVEVSGDEELPVFKVQRNGIEYMSSDMGNGELAVFYLLWRLLQRDPPDLLLVEEPETFVSPRSQVALADYLARFAAENDTTILFSSHSPDVIERAPIQNIRVLLEGASGRSVCQPAARNSDLRILLGLGVPTAGVCFVEDRIARILLTQILSQLGFFMSMKLK